MGRHKKSKRKNLRAMDEDGRGNEETEADLPYNVETSEVMGRYLTARRDLKPGEIIIVDERIVIGPCQESKPMCIGCFVDINLDDEVSYKRCWKCSWPLCSNQCPGSYSTPACKNINHTSQECDFLSKSLIKNADAAAIKSCFYALTPLRLLMTKLFKPEIWEIVEKMEAHNDARREKAALWEANERLAVEKIQKVFGLSDFSPDDIHFACGVLEKLTFPACKFILIHINDVTDYFHLQGKVNAFEVTISENRQPLRAIYPNASLFSHDCVCNTSHSNGENFSLIVRATTAIAKKSPLTVSYTYTLQSTLKRREHLLETKFFLCSCKRCSDVTEFGLYCSAFKCPRCKIGLLLPEEPLVFESDWSCKTHKCPHKVPASTISMMSERISNELDSIKGDDIEGYEKFLRKYSSILHENNHLCLSALHSLSQLYGKTRGYIIHELTEEQLDRKAAICRKLLKIFEKLEPGLSKTRGVLLYELQAPLMVILNRRFQQENIPERELKQKLGEVIKCLEETCKIFASEWRETAEGLMAEAAKEALKSMKGENRS